MLLVAPLLQTAWFARCSAVMSAPWQYPPAAPVAITWPLLSVRDKPSAHDAKARSARLQSQLHI
jgi:hypothetical protein